MNSRFPLALAGVLLAGAGLAAPAEDDTGPAEQVLPALIQKMLDALPGDAGPWRRYMAEEAFYVGEDGEVVAKKQFVERLRPFPEGLSGQIRIRALNLREFGDTAVAVFDAVESEQVFGQHIEVTYLNTQTWRRRESGHWRLLAAQVAVRAKDPPPLPADTQRFADYAGTYALGTRRYVVQARGDSLSGGPGKELKTLIPVADNVFAESGSRLGVLDIFLRGKGGAVDHMVQRRKYADLDWVRAPPEGPAKTP